MLHYAAITAQYSGFQALEITLFDRRRSYCLSRGRSCRFAAKPPHDEAKISNSYQLNEKAVP